MGNESLNSSRRTRRIRRGETQSDGGRGVEARYAKGVGRYCNARDVSDNVAYTHIIRACSRACICVYIRQSRGRLSLIHIHQTLINHRPAHPRRATPLAAHEAGKKIRALSRRHLHILRSYIQMSKSSLRNEIFARMHRKILNSITKDVLALSPELH